MRDEKKAQLGHNGPIEWTSLAIEILFLHLQSKQGLRLSSHRLPTSDCLRILLHGQ